jgi:hypothetical protein
MADTLLHIRDHKLYPNSTCLITAVQISTVIPFPSMTRKVELNIEMKQI